MRAAFLEETRVEVCGVRNAHTHLFYCRGARGEENECLLNVNIKLSARRVPVSHFVARFFHPRFYYYVLRSCMMRTEFLLMCCWLSKLGRKCEFRLVVWFRNRERMCVIKFTLDFMASNARLDSSYFLFWLFACSLPAHVCGFDIEFMTPSARGLIYVRDNFPIRATGC